MRLKRCVKNLRSNDMDQMKFRIEPQSIRHLFKDLESMDVKKSLPIYRSSLLAGMKIAEKKTRENVGSHFKVRSRSVVEMQASVKASFNKSKLSANIHVFGNRYLKRSFVLRLFAASKETNRYNVKWRNKRLKRMRNTGYVAKTDFFKGIDEQAIYDKIEKEYQKKLYKLFYKR